jgi:hypothetical protein
MRSKFDASDVLEILAFDVDPNDFYDVFFSEAERKGFDLPALDENSDLGRDEDVVQAVSGLALRFVKEERFGGSRAALCREYEISKDKAYRLNKFLRNTRIFTAKTDNVYVGCERFLSVYQENGIEISVDARETRSLDETINVETNGNEGHVSASNTTIDNVEDLLDYAGIDREKWEATDSDIGHHEVPMKLREIVDYKENGDPIYIEKPHKEMAFSFDVELEAKELEPVEFAPLAPVEISVTQQYEATGPQNSRDGFETVLFVPDPQVGFRREQETGEYDPTHDRRALDVMLQVAAYLDPDRITVLGDWLDMTNWTRKYTQSQEFRETTNPALQEGQWWLKQLALQHPDAKKDYLLGNHEARVRDSLLNHYGQAYQVTPGGRMDAAPLMSVDAMLELTDMGYEVTDPYPHGEVWLNDNLKAIHGESAAKTVNRKLINKHNVSTVQGHNHRIGMKSGTMQFRNDQRPVHGVTAGCLCRTDPGIVPAVSNRMNWQQGIVHAQYDPSGYQHNININRIHNGVCYFRDQVFEAQPQIENIQEDTDYGDRFQPVFEAMK